MAARKPAAKPAEVEDGSRVAAVPVHVHAETGPVAYAAGARIPAEHVTLISNPNVWAEPEPEPEPVDTGQGDDGDAEDQ
jgi:hypothetical protein